jgi:hypothetical protein
MVKDARTMLARQQRHFFLSVIEGKLLQAAAED